MKILLGLLLFYGRFGLSFSSIGFHARRVFWKATDSSLEGRRVLVTGGSGGIGRAVVEQCLAAGAEVTAIARNAQKLAQLEASLPQDINTIVADLSEHQDISSVVSKLNAAGKKIDVLVNNVGVMLEEFQQNSDEVDSQFATNLLHQYSLTEALVAEGLLGKNACVITVSSGGMYMAPMVVNELNTDKENEHDGTHAYSVQKRAQVMLSHYWQLIYGDQANFYVMHPGWVDTAGVRESLPTFRMLLSPILRDAEQGADTIVWLAKTLPKQDSDPIGIWFDRTKRSVHAYAYTRTGSDSIGSLLKHLQRFLS